MRKKSQHLYKKEIEKVGQETYIFHDICRFFLIKNQIKYEAQKPIYGPDRLLMSTTEKTCYFFLVVYNLLFPKK